MKTCKPKNRLGFTLIEVMVAVGLLASLTAVTWISITNVYKSRDLISERTSRYQQIRNVLDRMTLDIGATFIAGPQMGGERIPGESVVPAQEGQEEGREREKTPADLAIGQRQYGLIGSDDKINFTSMGHRLAQPNERASYASEIGYFIRSELVDGERVSKLMRREDVTIDKKLERGGVIYPVLVGIESIKFEYWDSGPVKTGKVDEVAEGRWVKDWNTTRSSYGGRLPSRIRVTLSMPSQNGSMTPEVFSVEIPIVTTEVMEF